MASIQIFQHNDVEYGIHVRQEGQEDVYFLYVEVPEKFIRPDFSEEYGNLSDLLIEEGFQEGETISELAYTIQDRLDEYVRGGSW